MEKMVNFERALELVLEQTPSLESELIEVHRAKNRILAEDILAKLDLPALPISLRDGYAINSKEAQAGKKLKLAGEIYAGSQKIEKLKSEQAFWIATGAVIPEGADAVIEEELVEKLNGEIQLKEKISSGANIKPEKEEFAKGDQLLKKGTLLEPRSISLLIAGGYSELKVYRAPRLWVIAIGDELREIGKVIEDAQVYPSSGWLVAMLAQNLGAELERFLIINDDSDSLKEALPSPEEVDLVLTIGGTGFGRKDIIIDALTGLDIEVIFQGIKIRPCHSLIFSRNQKQLIFSLPGRISASEVGFELLVAPAILKMQNLSPELKTIPIKIKSELQSPKGQLHIFRAILEKKDKELWAEVLREKSAHKELSRAEGFVLVPEEKEQVKAGESLEFLPYSTQRKNLPS